MVSVIVGSGAGLGNTSRELVGAGGELGSANMGRAGERVSVNAATGNLVVQRQDEFLSGVGPDISLLRTYNSQGGWDGDNSDGWRMGYYRKVYGLSSGSPNVAGSSIKRIDADGLESTYLFDGSKYVCTDGNGQYDTLRFLAALNSWTWTDGDTGVQESYQSSGSGNYRLSQITDPEGHAVKVSYLANGLIGTLATWKSGAAAASETVALSYDANARLQSISTSYRDSSNVNRTRSLTRYEYDATSGKLNKVITDLTPEDSSVADGKTYNVSYSYDGNGRLRTVEQTDGTKLTITYAADGRVQTITDAQNHLTRFDYDLVTRTTTVTDALLQTTQLVYDASNRLLEVRGAAMGGATFKQSYTYSANGDLLTSINGKGETTTFEYTANGALKKRTDAAGNVLERSYDAANGLLLEQTTFSNPDPDGPSGPATATGAQTTRYLYDTAGGKRRLKYAQSADGLITKYQYDPTGWSWRTVYQHASAYTGATWTLAALDTWSTQQWQAAAGQLLVSQEGFDARGNLFSTTQHGEIAWDSQTDALSFNGSFNGYQTFDAFGRLIATSNDSGQVTAYTYDGLNRLQTVTDPTMAVTTYTYDDLGRATSIRLQNGQLAVQLFDTVGNLVSSEEMGSVNVGLGKTEYVYDALGRLRRVKEPTGVSTWMLYDPSGRKSADIAANGQLTEYLYDGAGREIQRIAYVNLLSSVQLASLSDAAGQPTNVALGSVRPTADSQDRITTRYYDAAGRLVGVRDADGYVTETRYDGASAITATITYAAAGAVSRLSVGADATVATSLVPSLVLPTADSSKDRSTRYFYSAAGRLLGQIDAEGYFTHWSYDAGGNKTRQVRLARAATEAQRATGTLADLLALPKDLDDEIQQWVYDNAGRCIAELSAEGYLTTYAYDGTNRLERISRYTDRALDVVTGSASAVVYQTLTRSQVSTLSMAFYSVENTMRFYNGRGQLQMEMFIPTGGAGRHTFYAYDELGRLLSTQVMRMGAMRTTGQVTYDTYGRVATEVDGKGKSITHSYDASGRRIKTEDRRGNVSVYYYDDAGRLSYTILKTSEGGEVTETLYSAFGEVQTNVRYSNRLSVADTAALTGGALSNALLLKVQALDNTTRSDDVAREQASYNRRGLIQQAIDALGNKTDYTYNAVGQIATHTADVDQLGAVAVQRRLTTTYAYDRRGLQTGITQSAVALSAVNTRAQYDAFGRQIKTWDGRDQLTTTQYLRDDGQGRKVIVTDASGSATTVYGAMDRVLQRIDRSGRKVSVVHDIGQSKITLTTDEGISTVTEYNAFGQVLAVTNGENQTTTYAYDQNGNLLTVTDALGNLTRNSYDDNNNLIRVERGLKAGAYYGDAPSNDGSAVTTETQFDAANRVLKQIVDPTGLGLTTTYQYDGQGRKLSVTEADGTPQARTTGYYYDAKGQLNDIVVDDVTSGLKLKTSYRYDAQGRMLRLTEGAGTADAKATSYEFDELGRRTAEIIDPDGLRLTTRYEYDAAGNLIRKYDALNQLTRFVYDGANRLEISIDATGAVTRKQYDAEGRLLQSRALATRLGVGWASTTDADLRTSVSSLVGVGDRLTAWAYDQDGRQVYAVDALGGVTRSTYDKAGRVVQVTQSANTIAWAEEALSVSEVSARLVIANAANPANAANDRVTRYVMDAAGRRTHVIDAEGGVERYTLDRNGQILQRERLGTLVSLAQVQAQEANVGRSLNASELDALLSVNATKDRTDRYAYDNAGRQRFHVDAENYVSEYRFDALGRTTQTLRYPLRLGAASSVTMGALDTPAARAALGEALVTQATYDRAGRLETEVDGVGSVTRYAYYANGLLRTTTRADGTSSSTVTYCEYDKAGRKTAVTTAFGTQVAATAQFAYDAVGRLVAETDPRALELATRNDAWAKAERLRYSLAEDLQGLSAAALTQLKGALQTCFTTVHAYASDGQSRTDTNALGGSTRTDFDAFGQGTKITDARGYVSHQRYDRKGQLVQAVDAERYLTVHSYNAFGDRVSTVRHDSRVQGTLLEGQQVAVLNAAGSSGAYVVVDAAHDARTFREWDHNGRLLREGDAEQQVEGSQGRLNAFGEREAVINKLGAVALFLFDRLGRVLSETLPVQARNASNQWVAVVNEYTYDAYGNRVLAVEAKGLPEQRLTEMRYDKAQRLRYRIEQSVTAYDSTGQSSTVTPVTEYVYDLLGQRIEQRVNANWNGSAAEGGKRSLAYYDPQLRKVAEVSADRVLGTFEYDSAGNVIVESVFATRIADAVVLTPGGAVPSTSLVAASDRILRHRYDALNRKTETILDKLYSWDSSGAQLIISGLQAQNTVLQRLFYDAAGNLTERQDGRGNSSFDYFDGIGRRVFSIDAGGSGTRWTYGSATTVATRETRYAASAPAGYVRQADKLIEQTSANNPTQIAALYESLFLPVGGQNRVTEQVLDRLGRVTEKRVIGVEQDAVAANGQRTRQVADAVTRYTYNGLGGVTQIRERASLLGGVETWEQTDIQYDGLGRETRRQAPGFVDWAGATVRPTTDTEINGLGQVTRSIQRGNDAASEADDRITRHEYDINGRLVQTTDPTGAITRLRYNATGDISEQATLGVLRADGTTRDVLRRYAHDASGRVVAETTLESDKPSAAETRKTRYNAFGDAIARGIGDGWEEFAEYTTLGKVIKTNAGDGAVKFYLHDAAGNLTREIRGNGDPIVNLLTMGIEQAAVSTQLYSRISIYNAKNLLSQTIDPQIDVLKNTVTMGQLYGAEWVPAWAPTAPSALISATILPNAQVSILQGSQPRLVFSDPNSQYIEVVTTNSSGDFDQLFYRENVSSVTGGPIQIDVSSLAGQGPRRIYYQMRKSMGSWGDDNLFKAMGRLEINVSSSGYVSLTSLPPLDRDRAPAMILFSGDVNRPNQWIYFSFQVTVDGQTFYYSDMANYQPQWPEMTPASVNLSAYRPVSGYKDVTVRYETSGSIGLLTVRLWADGSLQQLGNSGETRAMPVSLYVKGRNVPYSALELTNLRTGARMSQTLSGSWTPNTSTSFGYSSFTGDLAGFAQSGDEISYELTGLDSNYSTMRDELGNYVRQVGRIVMTGNAPPQVQQQVRIVNTSEKVTIKRFQDFNAFGEVSEERDERVGERMLAAINEARRAAGQGVLTALTAEQLALARTTLQYNVLGQITAKLDPETFITADNGYRYRERPATLYGYDLLGRHTTTTDANGNLSRMTHAVGARGEAGAAAVEFDANGGTADAFNTNSGSTRQFARDVFGDVRRITDAAGGIVEQDFDAASRLVRYTRKNATRADNNGNFAAAYDVVDRYDYDQLGQRIRYHNPLANQGAAGIQPVQTDYDALGRVVQTVTAGGAITRYTYALRYANAADGISAMAGAASGSKSGGYVKTTLQSDGRNLVDEVEYFGHTMRHTDLSGMVLTYTYNSAGQLERKTSTVHAGQSKGQDTKYSYYANGYIRSLTDVALGTSGEYAYDNAGNRVYEAYFKLDAQGTKVSAYQNSTLTYDELNRLVRAQDIRLAEDQVQKVPLYDIRYEFDAVGNRRLVDSLYWDGQGGFRDRQTYWYGYDSMNRFVVTKGRLSSTSTNTSDINRYATARRGSSKTDTTVRIEAGSEGILIGYDKLSQRTLAEYTYAGAAVKEIYGYSSDGYLQTTRKGDGSLQTLRLIDALGRTYSAQDRVNNQTTTSQYDADNRLIQQSLVDALDASKSYSLSYSYYDSTSDTTSSANGKGALAQTILQPTQGGSATTTTYKYDYWDSALQKQIQKSGPTGSGTSSFTYNANGAISATYDWTSAAQNLFETTATGLVLKRTRNGNRTHYFYYADDRRIGDVSDTPDDITRVSYAEQLALKTSKNKRTYYREVVVGERTVRTRTPDGWEMDTRPITEGRSTADFDQNYEPINDNYPGAAASNYTVRYDGESLRSVAQTLWGDGAMWYLIAEANGLSDSSSLRAGQLLVIPNKVTNIHNNSSTWRPYNAGEAIGQTDPTLPTPKPPKKGCGVLGTVLMVVVAVVATIYTAGAAATYFAPVGTAGVGGGLFSTGLAALSGGIGSGLAGAAISMGAAAIGGAVGAIASQGVGLLTGNVESFSWKAVGQAALGSFVTAGVGAAAQGIDALKFLRGQEAWQAAGRAAVGTGANLALRNDWNWRSVMISAMSAGVGSAVGQAINGTAIGSAMGDVGRRFTSGMAGALVARSLSRGPRANYATVFASTLGNALGESLAANAIGESLASYDATRDPTSARYENEMDRMSDAAHRELERANGGALPIYTKTFSETEDQRSSVIYREEEILNPKPASLRLLPSAGIPKRISLETIKGLDVESKFEPLAFSIPKLALDPEEISANQKTLFLRSEIDSRNNQPSAATDLRVPDSIAAAPIRVDLSPMQDRFNMLWANSFPGGRSQEFGGTIVANEAGALDLVNMRGGTRGTFLADLDVKPGTSPLGVFHTHPYDATEYGYTGVSLSGGDAAAIVNNRHNIIIAQSGDEQFMFMRTTESPERVDYAEARRNGDSRVHELTPIHGFVKANAINAAEFADRFKLAYYKGANGIFRRVN